MPADKNVRAIVGTVPLIVITGHYGVGKTNLALNLARDLRAVYPRVTLVDLDIVNPYFRSSDSCAFLAQHDIALLGPSHAGGNLDTPSLAPGIDTAIETASASHAVVVDVGGDPDGARALGRFASSFPPAYRLLFVVNLNRPEARDTAHNLELLRAIEQTSGLTVTHVLGNTHLKELTTAATIAAALPATQELATQTAVPLAALTAPRPLVPEVEHLLATQSQQDPTCYNPPVYPVDLIVGTPWEI